MMNGLLIAIVLCLSALGYGAMLFKALRIHNFESRGLAFGLSFAAGYGLIGWLIFPIGAAGSLDAPFLWALIALGLLGLWTLRAQIYPPSTTERPTIIHYGLVVLFVIVGFFDIVQALAPPSDADSLAYHFALPKQFIQAGEIFFVPRAVDGAVPLLVQMGYVPALGLGGEHALTFWVMLSSWALYLLVYGLARTRMSVAWSLAATLAVATTPTVIYGSGSGQVEVRIALFVILAAWAAAKAIEIRHIRYIVLCGIAAGLYGASKYVGLIFMTSTAVVIMMQPRWFRAGFIFSATAVIAGGQWYLWNFLNTGDPVFPMLFPLLGVSDPTIWNADYQQMLKDVFFASETPVPVTLFGFLSYPFIATFNPPFHLDAGRTGFGPFLILLLPFVLAATLARKASIRWNDVAVWSVIVVGFFALWFFTGAPQRIRHLLPVWPLALVLMFFAIHYSAKAWKVETASGLVILGVLVIQVGGAAVFGLKFIDVALGKVSPEQFRENTISHFAPVPWLNENLKPTDRVMTPERQHLYNLKIPSFFAQEFAQAIVPVNPELGTAHMVERMSGQGITHIVAYSDPNAAVTRFQGNYQYLLDRQCMQEVHSGSSNAIASRTLAGQSVSLKFHVFEFTPNRCRPGN